MQINGTLILLYFKELTNHIWYQTVGLKGEEGLVTKTRKLKEERERKEEREEIREFLKFIICLKSLH